MSPMAGEAEWSLRPETDHPTSGGHDDPPIATGAQRPVNHPCPFADGSPIPAFLTAPATGTRLASRPLLQTAAIPSRPCTTLTVLRVGVPGIQTPQGERSSVPPPGTPPAPPARWEGGPVRRRAGWTALSNTTGSSTTGVVLIRRPILLLASVSWPRARWSPPS
jgi:hypothetical protein